MLQILKNDVTNAVQGDLTVRAVKASDRKDGVAIVKDSGCCVRVGYEKLVAKKQGLRLNRKISQGCCINANDGTVGGVAVEEAIREDSFAKFAVAAVKSRAMENLRRGE